MEAFTKDKTMMEDNPFYGGSVGEVPAPLDAESVSEAPVPDGMELSGEPSAGVSTYTSIPDIGAGVADCSNSPMDMADKLNLWSVLLGVILMMALGKRESCAGFLAKVEARIRKYDFPVFVLLFLCALSVFTYPGFFRVGISGNISLAAMLEFGLFIFLNAASLVYAAVVFLKKRGRLLPEDPVAFPGMNFLGLSLWTFVLTALLFLFFTESRIAFMTLHAFSAGCALLMFLKLDSVGLRSLGRLAILSAGLQLALIGSLSGIYFVLLSGAFVVGHVLSEGVGDRLLRVFRKIV